MEDLKNPKSDSTLHSSIPDSKFSFLQNKKSLFIGMILISIILIVPLFIFISSTLRSQKQLPVPSTKEFKPATEYVPDQIIVKYKEKYTREEIINLKEKLDAIGIISQEKVFDSDAPTLRNFYLLKLKKGTDVVRIRRELLSIPEIEAAEPNYIKTTQQIPDPDDTYFTQLWGLRKIDMLNAWKINTGSTGITVAVIDSGVDYDHEDLPRDIIRGPDYLNNDSDPKDDCGHGTHVTGTIGALTNNAKGVSGVTGVNLNIKLMVIKVLGRSGTKCVGTDGLTNDAIRYAVLHDADVINMSLGGAGNCSRHLGDQEAINYAIDNGVIVVVAAGNDNMDANGQSPASCNGVIAVGNSNQNDQRNSTSNFGSRVEIAAPGTGIYSTYKNGTYNALSGTSMAAPHVAGVAALLLSANPNLSLDPSRTSELVLNCLVRNADDVVVTDADKPIGPRLNAFKALNDPRCSGLAPITPFPSPAGTTPTLTLTPTQPGQSSSSISGNIFVDKNSNGTKDSDEVGPAGALITLDGPVVNDRVVPDGQGNFSFLNLSGGSYVVNMSINGQTACNSSFNLPQNTTITLTCIIPASGQPGPSPILILPTILPTPTLKPSPTPVKTYTCRERSDARPGKVGAIKIGDLICEPN